MSRYFCIVCQKCKDSGYEYCDDCNDTRCKNNMDSHNELFFLVDDFKNKINLASQELYNKCKSIQKNLNDNYSINLKLPCDSVDCCENYLNSMIEKKYEIQNNIKNIQEEINIIENNQKLHMNNLNSEYENIIKWINNIFSDEINKFETETGNNEIKKKKIKKDNLENIKKNIDKNKKEICNSFILEETFKAKQKFINEKRKIGVKFNEEEELKYTENELNLKQQYLTEIQKIKAYSNKIPNYYDLINHLNLNKYLE